MSNTYVTEPPTLGKVVLTTSCGPVDIELWAREAPLACRNFVQLCPLRGPPAPFPRDDFIGIGIVGMRPDEKRLQDALLPNRLGKLLKSDYVFINGLLANYYGIEGVTGDAFRKVKLPAGSPRGGLLGTAAIRRVPVTKVRQQPALGPGHTPVRHLMQRTRQVIGSKSDYSRFIFHGRCVQGFTATTASTSRATPSRGACTTSHSASAASAASTSDRSTARSTSSDLCGNQIYGAFA